MKPIPNINLHLKFKDLLRGSTNYRLVTDGELWSPELTFSELASVIRSQYEPIPESVGYYVFDIMSESDWDGDTTPPNFATRNQMLKVAFGKNLFPWVYPVEQKLVETPFSAQEMFETHIERNEEGIVLKNPLLGYKHGRCTHNENWMFKFKQFETHDAKVIAIEERMELKPGVERTLDAVGHLERVHTQDAYQPAGLVGALLVDWNGTQFRVKPGRGFNHNALRTLWEERKTLVGRWVEFKFMPKGTKDKPRIGSLVRFRPDLAPQPPL
jgi:ATP-dependent DNA ligase